MENIEFKESINQSADNAYDLLQSGTKQEEVHTTKGFDSKYQLSRIKSKYLIFEILSYSRFGERAPLLGANRMLKRLLITNH